MKIRYRVLSTRERGNLLLVAAYSAIVGCMFFGTALLFDPILPKAVYHQLMGGSKESPIPAEYRDVETNPEKMSSPLAIASMGFTFLAGLAFLFAIREVLISIFCTIAFLDIGVLLAVLVLVLGIGISFFRVFSIGGFWGLVPFLTLVVECAAIYLSIRFGLSRVIDPKETPLFGG